MARRCSAVNHIISVGFIGALAVVTPWGRGINAVNFFICGLPGLIDYALLFALKAGLLTDRLLEKRINRWLNIGVRFPGLLLVLYTGLVAKWNDGPGAADFSWVPILTTFVLHGANGLYYAERTVANYGYTLAKAERQPQKPKRKRA